MASKLQTMMSWDSMSENLAHYYSEGTILTALFAVWISYLVSLALFRLYLSPLSKFPGPKLAAFSTWYEAYYEIVLSGHYSHKINELHDLYGTSPYSGIHGRV